MGTTPYAELANLFRGANSGPGYVALRKSANGSELLSFGSADAKPVIDAGKMKVTSVIVTKCVDQQGDIVDPDGGDFSVHQFNPVVFFDHCSEYPHPIAMAERPDGSYTVRKAADRLIADTYFKPSNQVSCQLFRLVEDDLIRGWSVGFDPVKEPGAVETIRKSVGRGDRGSYRFNKWVMREYSLTPQPVNPETLTVLVEKSRVGSEPMHPMICKSLARFKISTAGSVAVPEHALTGVKKAMADQNTDDDMPPDPYADDAGSPKPSVAALAGFAQGLLDICEQTEQTMGQSDNPKFIKFSEQLCAEAKKLAAKAQAMSDKIEKMLGGSDDDDVNAETDKDEPDTDDDGTVVTKSGYKPRRWTMADVRKAEEETRQAQKNKDYQQACLAELNKVLSKLTTIPALKGR